MKSLTAGRPVDPADRLIFQQKRAASEGRLDIDGAVLFSKHDSEISLGELKLDLDLAALNEITCIPQLGAQFLDMLFDGHRLISLSS